MNPKKINTLSPLEDEGEKSDPKPKPEPAAKTLKSPDLARPPMREAPVPLEVLTAHYRYDPMTGLFRHKVGGERRRRPGTVAGGLKDGYVILSIDRVYFRAHRAAWAHYYGSWPEKHIDHINGNRSDNRISNLREATVSENVCNSCLRITNRSGVRGVCWDKRKNLWLVRVNIQKTAHFIGYFSDLERAKQARAAAVVCLHGNFARF